MKTEKVSIVIERRTIVFEDGGKIEEIEVCAVYDTYQKAKEYIFSKLEYYSKSQKYIIEGLGRSYTTYTIWRKEDFDKIKKIRKNWDLFNKNRPEPLKSYHIYSRRIQR